ncbi:MAG: acylphosphatase [Candidatus Gastranaerophilaceae bacterium]|jgi:acylphosphatase
MAKVRKHVFIYGKVQGVGYRYSAFNMAVNLGIKGWVRNKYDGSVEAMLEGDEVVLNQMIEWCKKGPFMSHVENVEIYNYNYEEEFSDFSIRG